MKPLALLVLYVCTALAVVPPPIIQWQRGFGEPEKEFRVAVARQLADGGYVLGANVDSGDDLGDVRLFRLDGNGNILWQKTYGGSDVEVDDRLNDMQQTSDGGFVLFIDSNVPSGITDTNKTDGGFGDRDFWVLRLDGQGNRLWDHTFGHSGENDGRSILQLPDSGFGLIGGSMSGTNGNKTSPNYGLSSMWFVRLDTNGTKTADLSFGGEGPPYGGISSGDLILPTTDGGFLLAGTSDAIPSGNKTSPVYGEWDIWLVRVDASGNKVWDRSFGGTARENPTSLQETNGGFVITGGSNSGASGNKTNAATGLWTFGLDGDGNKLWEQVLTNSYFPYGPIQVSRTGDGGHLLAGRVFTLIYPDPEEPTYSEQEWNYGVMRVEATGQGVWQASFGGPDHESFQMALLTADGGMLLAGESYSGVGGAKTVPKIGDIDVWLVKLMPDALNAPPRLRPAPQNSSLIASNGYRFTLSGVSNADYVVERSADFSNWSPVSTNRLGSNQVPFLDPSATNVSRRFYRARVLR